MTLAVVPRLKRKHAEFLVQKRFHVSDQMRIAVPPATKPEVAFLVVHEREISDKVTKTTRLFDVSRADLQARD
jgi:hypothetical protein